MVNLGKIYLVTGSEMDTIFRWLDLLERHRAVGQAVINTVEKLDQEDRERFWAVLQLAMEGLDGQLS